MYLESQLRREKKEGEPRVIAMDSEKVVWSMKGWFGPSGMVAIETSEVLQFIDDIKPVLTV